jgi:coenzyme F420 hydrogenase subunit beta
MRNILLGFTKLQRESIDTGLCVACGACATVCPEQLIKMKDGPIAPEPYRRTWWDRSFFCRMCAAACPAARVPMGQLETMIFGRKRHQSQPEKTLGVFQECYMARTKVKAIDEQAVAGGVLTTLLTYALESGLIDAAVVAGFDEERPWIAVPKVANTPEELAAAAGSKYQPHPQILGLREAVDKGFKKVAVTGTPCHIHALRKMQLSGRFRDLTDKLVLTLGLVCTTHWTVEGTEYLIRRQLGVPLEDVVSMKYRARPFTKYGGMFEVVTKDGQVKSEPFVTDSRFLRHLFAASQPDACRTCLDGAGHLADVSAGDLWGNPTAMEETMRTGKAKSATLLRTDLGRDLFHRALDDGWLEAEAVDKEDCFTVDNGAVYRKAYANAAFMKWRKEHGLPVREYDYEIEEMSLIEP